MRFSASDSESKLWHLIFLHLMTFLVTLTSHFVLPLEMSGFLEPSAYMLGKIRMKMCNPSIFEALTFYIGFNGHVPDEYVPDVIESNRLYLNLTISILWWYAKLHYHSSRSFRVISKKPFHKIRQRTVGAILCIMTYYHGIPKGIWFWITWIFPC